MVAQEWAQNQLVNPDQDLQNFIHQWFSQADQLAGVNECLPWRLSSAIKLHFLFWRTGRAEIVKGEFYQAHMMFFLAFFDPGVD